jgi:hypothetical protein
MNLSNHPYFPYPRDQVTRVGFMIGDLIALGVIVLILYAVFQVR